VNVVTKLSFVFTICNPLPAGGSIELTIDPQFRVNASPKTTHDMSGDVVVFPPTDTARGSQLTVQRLGNGFDIPSGTKISLTIDGIRNPSVPSPVIGEGGTFAVATRASAGSNVDVAKLLDNDPKVLLNTTFVGKTLESTNELCMLEAVEWTPTHLQVFKDAVGETHGQSAAPFIEIKSVETVVCVDPSSPQRRLQAASIDVGDTSTLPAQTDAVIQYGSFRMPRQLTEVTEPPSAPRVLVQDFGLTTTSVIGITWQHPETNFVAADTVYTIKYKPAASQESQTVLRTGSSVRSRQMSALMQGTT
jgi:hypothetical protein